MGVSTGLRWVSIPAFTASKRHLSNLPRMARDGGRKGPAGHCAGDEGIRKIARKMGAGLLGEIGSIHPPEARRVFQAGGTGVQRPGTYGFSPRILYYIEVPKRRDKVRASNQGKNMKKYLFLVALGLLFSSVAVAECQLTDFIGGESDGSSSTGNALLEISSAYSSSSSTYSSAQASGTSGCGDTAISRVRQLLFVRAMMDNLSQEIAQGGGEHLQSLGTLLGCPKSDYAQLALMAQGNYRRLFPTVEPEPEAFLARLKGQLREHPRIWQSCIYI